MCVYEPGKVEPSDDPRPFIRMRIPVAGLLAGYREPSQKQEDAETAAILLAEQAVVRDGHCALRLHLFSSVSKEGAVRLHRCPSCGVTTNDIDTIKDKTISACMCCDHDTIESGFFFVDHEEDEEVELTDKGHEYLDEKESGS